MEIKFILNYLEIFGTVIEHQLATMSNWNLITTVKNVKYSNDNSIYFDSAVTDDNVLAFFIEMTHL